MKDNFDQTNANFPDLSSIHGVFLLTVITLLNTRHLLGPAYFLSQSYSTMETPTSISNQIRTKRSVSNTYITSLMAYLVYHTSCYIDLLSDH